MNVVRPSDEKVTPERYCSSCHPYGWPNGPMPHEPWCTAAPVIRPSNANAIRLSNLRIFLHKVESAIQTNRDSGQTWVDRRDLQLLREFEKQLTAPETLEHDVWCPMGSPSLTCTCAERGSQKASESLKDHTK